MFRDIGPMELLLILLVVLVIFGAAKLPSIGRDLGKSIREFRKASSEDLDDEKKTDAKATAQATTPAKEKEDKK